MRVLIVSTTKANGASIRRWFESKQGFSVEQRFVPNQKAFGEKNYVDGGLGYHIACALFFVNEIARFNFTAKYFLKYRSFGAYSLLYKAIGWLSLQPRLRGVLPLLQSLAGALTARLDPRDVGKFDLAVFTNVLSTKVELGVYHSLLKSGAKIIYWPFNWDNPYSKLNSIPVFDHTICWGEEMRDFCAGRDMYGTVSICPVPRLNYLKNIRQSRDPQPIALVALSQKRHPRYAQLFEELSRFATRSGMELIVRPHPQSIFDTALNDLIRGAGLSVDKSYLNYLSRFPDGGQPVFDATFRRESSEVLTHIKKQASLVLCEAGTICLEALAVGIPVAVLANNRWQKTASMNLHYDHFRSLAQIRGTYLIVDDKWAAPLAEWLSTAVVDAQAVSRILDLDAQAPDFVAIANDS